jgi:hypothetical protein
MATLAEQYSNHNVANSVALWMATRLLTAGYLIYWHQRDAVQTLAGWYYEYSTKRAVYLADSTFQAAYAAAKGISTITESLSAESKFIIRPVVDGSIGPAENVPLPVLGVQIGDAIGQEFIELGSLMKFRWRHLVVDCFTRNRDENKLIADALAVWFDEGTSITVSDHGAGTLANFGDVTLRDVRVDSAVWLDKPEERRYQVILNARLEYVA